MKVKLKNPSDPLNTKKLKKEINSLKEYQSKLLRGDKTFRNSLFSSCNFSMSSLCICIILMIVAMFVFTSAIPFISKWQQFVDSVSFIFGNL